MANLSPLHSVEMETTSSQDEACTMMSAIRDALAILDAIEQGGLFEALPEFDNDRSRHRTGITLIALMEQRLRQAVGNPKRVISGE
jgi:hypothetical protein